MLKEDIPLLMRYRLKYIRVKFNYYKGGKNAKILLLCISNI